MKSASSPDTNNRNRWIKLGVAALIVSALLAGMALLQERAATEAKARKNPTALAFERDAERWLANPKEASEFERAIAAREVQAVAVDGLLVLYTDKSGGRHS